MFLRIVALLFFSYFLLIPEGEARRSPSHQQRVLAKQKAQAAAQAKRKQHALALKKRTEAVKKARVTAKQRRQAIVKKPQRRAISSKKRKQQALVQAPRKRAQRPSVVKKSPPRKPIVARKQAPRPSVAKKSSPRRVPQKQESYFSLLNTQTQKNAKVGGLAPLLTKNYCGQGETIALIEYSGTWKEIKNVINGTYGHLPAKIRENYKRGFLSPIGGTKLHPDAETDGVAFFNKNDVHGSHLASLLLDLAPQAKVLPVSTYCSRGHSYDVADALLNLARRPDVRVINISAGGIEKDLKSQIEYHNNSTRKRKVKWTFPSKYMEAFKAIARAGKTIIVAAGNEGEDLPHDEFREKLKPWGPQFMGYLIENLDQETLESVVFAGNLDPDTRQLKPGSNRPGPWKKAQDRFLFAPAGKVQVSYSGEIGDGGTSSAAPYICVALASILSKPGNKWAPKRVLKALLDSAEKRDARTYGRGIIRADKALELLEKGF